VIAADSAPILVLSPHLDDAVLSTFRVLTSGDPVAVVNVFAGVPERGTPTEVWGRICGFDDAHDYEEARLREDVAALDSLDVAPVYLPFGEHEVRVALGDPPPSVDVLLAEIEAVVPRARFVLAPLDGSDRGHPDHALVRAAAIRLLYEGVPVALYADFPHVCKARSAWPVELFSGATLPVPSNGFVPPRVDATVRWSKKLPGVVPEIDPLYSSTVWLLDDDARERKRATMEMYATQYRPLDRSLRSKGLVSDPALYGVEVAVPVTPR
jgi:LmbE family N-acetylglucosaminyl deacetylase